MIVCSHPEDGLRCRQGVKHPLKLKPTSRYGGGGHEKGSSVKSRQMAVDVGLSREGGASQTDTHTDGQKDR